MKNSKKELIRAAKFTLFSASAGIIQVLVFALMTELLPLSYWPCYLTSLIISVLWNFTLNRSITFRSAGNVPVAMLKVAAYYVVFTPVSTWGGDWLTGIGWNEYLVLAISMLTNFATEFLYDRYVVFGATIDTKQKKEKSV